MSENFLAINPLNHFNNPWVKATHSIYKWPNREVQLMYEQHIVKINVIVMISGVCDANHEPLYILFSFGKRKWKTEQKFS